MEHEIQFCTSADGVRIACATSGSGPPLVRVTNWLTHVEFERTSPIWGHWFDELSRHHRLVRYDARGTGLSDREVETPTIEDWVRDLEAVVDALELERFPLLGFCQGGAVAATFAARHPERVSRLVLCGSYIRGAYTDGAPEEMIRRAEALEQMIDVGWNDDSHAFREVFANLLLPEGTREEQRWLAELQRESVDGDMARRLWRAFHEIDVRGVAEQVATPTLAFHVRGDDMVPFEYGRALAAAIPDARFVPLAGDHHLMTEDEPAWQRFLRELRSFLGVRRSRNSTSDDETFGELTPRELEVLALLAEGLSNDQIAADLHISQKTVRNHVTRIYSKLEVDSRAKAIVMARDSGLGQPS